MYIYIYMYVYIYIYKIHQKAVYYLKLKILTRQQQLVIQEANPERLSGS